jgi:serine protease Do
MMAAATLTAAAGAGGLYAATPDGPEQGRRVVIEREGGGGQDRDARVIVRKIQDTPGFEVFDLGGGSRVGIVVRDVETADVAKEKLAGPAGAVVTEVVEDSAAGKAGVKTGDVVTSFDGERVRSARQLQRLVSETPAGRTVKMALQRAGASVTVEVTPEAPKVTQFFGPGGEEGFRWRQRGPGGEPGVRVEPFRFEMPTGRLDLEREGFPFVAASRGRLGVRVQDLSDELAGYFGVKAGVLVAGVEDDAPASKAGVKAGDVITAVNGEAVADPAELRREVAKVEEGKSAELSITRDRKPMTLKVEVTARDRAVERRMRRSL